MSPNVVFQVVKCSSMYILTYVNYIKYRSQSILIFEILYGRVSVQKCA